jgi:hypothetical protein
MNLQQLDRNAPQAEAFQVLYHLGGVAEAAEDRVQEQGDKVFTEMRDALMESIANNRLADERNTQLSARLIALENSNQTLAANRQAERIASDARITALNEKLETVITRLSQLEANYSTHTHNHSFCCIHNGKNCSQTVWKTTGPKDGK